MTSRREFIRVAGVNGDGPAGLVEVPATAGPAGWEYRQQSCDEAGIASLGNRLAADGWEILAVLPGGTLPPGERFCTVLLRRRSSQTRAVVDGAELRALIDDLRDPDPCSLDHHGYCQAHCWFETDPKCPHARAAEVLAAS